MKNLEFTFCPKGTITIRVLICACFVCVHGFDSLLQLPQSEPARIRPSSKRVLFVGDFGAKGDGLSNDTQACHHFEIIIQFPLYILRFILMFYLICVFCCATWFGYSIRMLIIRLERCFLSMSMWCCMLNDVHFIRVHDFV